MKIGIFSDFHWGLNKNSTEKLNVGIDVMRQFGNNMSNLGVDEVIFMGDWNHSRDYIHVNTQEVAREELIKFAKKFNKVHFIVGNHDIHYKDTNDINSVEQFSQIDNVFVYKKYIELLFGNKNFALCPWGTLPNPDGLNIDAAFGHFAFSGAALVGAVSTGSYTMEDVTKHTPLVFSGHFHIRKHYETNTGKVITTGCPYEQTWGDIGNLKGFYILDTDTMEIKFIENTFSPRHVSVRWSKLKNFDTSLIKNNYIKIIIDSDYEYDDVTKVMRAFHSAGARIIEPDYQYQKELSTIIDNLGDITIMSHEESINKYIDNMSISDDEREFIRSVAIEMFNGAHV